MALFGISLNSRGIVCQGLIRRYLKKKKKFPCVILRHLNYSQVAQGAHLFPGPDASAPAEHSKERVQSTLYYRAQAQQLGLSFEY